MNRHLQIVRQADDLGSTLVVHAVDGGEPSSPIPQVLADTYRGLLASLMEHRRRWLYTLFAPYMFLSTLWAAAKTLLLGLVIAPENGKRSMFHYAAVAKRLAWMGLFFDIFSPYMRRIRRGSMGHVALDLIYNYRQHRRNLGAAERLVCDFWVNTRNSQAVRNRLRILRRFLTDASERLQQNGEVRILSIACGGAQAIIEAAVWLRARGLRPRCILTDTSAEALEAARDLADQFGVSDLIETHKLAASKAIAQFAATVQIVEMVGLVDYLPDSVSVRYFSQIRRTLAVGGVFFTGHVHDNVEKWHTWFVVCWPMIYRTPAALTQLLEQGGWKRQEYCHVLEPHGIHSVVAAQRHG